MQWVKKRTGKQMSNTYFHSNEKLLEIEEIKQ